MNESLLYGLLIANLLLCYLIGLRVRAIKHDVECMHDFVHALGEHPFFAAFSDAERFSQAMDKKMKEEHQRAYDSQVPDPFKEWDEA